MTNAEQKLAAAQEAFALAPQQIQVHVQDMVKLRRHVAGKIAVELNKRLCAASPDWAAGASLTAWDVLDAIRMWHEWMVEEVKR